MLLAIDIGNTNTVFALLNGREIIDRWRCATEHTRTADEYYVWISTLMNLKGIDAKIEHVIVSSTVPRAVFNIRVLCDRYFNTRPLVVGKPECRLPVEPRVDPGTIVGPDRLVNATAGFDRYGGDIVVVDFGTATTFDVVDTDGAYIGGVIAPGVNLSLQALHMAAAALPHVDVTRPQQVIGKNTLACMQSGVFWGYIGLIDGITRQIRGEHPRDIKVIGTGGLAPLFASGEAVFDEVDADLTMHGLAVIHEYNLKG